jgi:hypothetical protein
MHPGKKRKIVYMATTATNDESRRDKPSSTGRTTVLGQHGSTTVENAAFETRMPCGKADYRDIALIVVRRRQNKPANAEPLSETRFAEVRLVDDPRIEPSYHVRIIIKRHECSHAVSRDELGATNGADFHGSLAK